MHQWLKQLVKWLTGPDFFFEIHQAPHRVVYEECVSRIAWLTDDQLRHLMDEIECEAINRTMLEQG